RGGCIPRKALLEASERYEEAQKHLGEFGINVEGVGLDLGKMMGRQDKIVDGLTGGVDFLYKIQNWTRYFGRGSIQAPGKVLVESDGGEKTELSCQHIIIATGSSVATLKGVELDGDRVGTSTEALKYAEVPDHLVVIGAGYIGLEMGSVWRRLGSKVTVVEYLDRILPGMDLEIAKEALKLFKKQGLDFKLGSKVTSARADGAGALVEIEGQPPIRCDRVLLSAGRKPNTEGLGLDELGVKRDRRGFVEADGHYRTNVPGIYAVGDVIGGAMLAHKAEEEGVACAELISAKAGHVNYDAIPGVVYTHPEIATVGKTEEELGERGVTYKKGVFSFIANGRARA